MSEPINVLISLYRGYGLGDAVQVSAVLRHVAKHYPHWSVDYQAEEGYHCVGRGLVANTFAYGERYPRDHYDREFQICLYDKWVGWPDRPNTHVSHTLKEQFDLDWNRHCGRYRVLVGKKAKFEASALCDALLRGEPKRRPFVALHYQGRTARANKDLSDAQAANIADIIRSLDCIPLLLDWDGSSALSSTIKVCSVARAGVLGADGLIRSWGASAEMTCALIRRCRAFVGIDSGPSKCASATDVPSLVVWTKHHPAKFHDPAPNTTHLVHWSYNSIPPVSMNPDVVRWFESNYYHQEYMLDPVVGIQKWLTEKLR